MQPSRDIRHLLEIMNALRSPETGCAWDRQQTYATIAPYTIEEAYEVADAITREDRADLRDELGDLLFQVVFHSRLAEEEGAFDFGGVVEAITAKMIRRHPHVFGAERENSPEAIKAQWQKIKAEEQAEKQARQGLEASRPKSLLDDVPLPLPGLTRSVKLQNKAAHVGFDWADARLVLAKVREETREIEEAIASGQAEEIHAEIGDLLFTIANLARHLNVDPEAAIRSTNAKFERRFAFIETALREQGKTLEEANLAEMDALWQQAKESEKSGG
ncbi:nucleoside triphosphate pyrophosphohydrolase [Beijerinckia indica]|nr:nucleoside triphosphate pyrophosphohydrolase [Beijerinckia indica]